MFEGVTERCVYKICLILKFKARANAFKEAFFC